jgi:hypothetical protein
LEKAKEMETEKEKGKVTAMLVAELRFVRSG